MVNPVGVVVPRGTRVLLLCVMALVSAACGDEECDRGGMPAYGCPFFAEDLTVPPERMEYIRSVAIPVEVSGDFSEDELVPSKDSGMSAVFFSFQATPGQRYRFTCQGITLGNCAIYILSGTGRLIASLEPNGPFQRPGPAFKATESGTWYAIAASHFPVAYGTFRYRLEGFGLDAHGDSSEEASPLSPSSDSFPGGLQGPGDQDFFAFTATAGNVYALTCEGPGDSIRWRLDLEESELYALPEQGQARLAFEAEASGTLFVSISYDAPASPDEEVAPEDLTPAYTCRFETLGPDDHGDTNDRATVLGLPVSGLAGDIESQGDRDVFSLQLEASHYYQVSCVPVDSGRCEVLLETEAGAQPQPQPSFPSGSAWKARSTGTHFLRVSGAGAYRLSVEDGGPDVHGDTKEEATLLTVSETPGQGSFQVREDVDAFAFDAQPDGIYELTCEWTATGPQDVLRMEWSGGDATGGGFSSASRSILAVEPRVATRITVLLSSPSASTPRPYTCVLRTRQDDHGDSLADAATLTFPASFTSRIDLPLDADVLRFAVEADHAYRFTCADPAAPCTFRLFNENAWPMHSSQAPDRMFIEHAPAQAGVVYLEVRGPMGVVLSVTATDLGPDDHGDDRATATPVAIGVPIRVYVPFEDPDVLRLDAASQRYYRVRCVRPDGSLSRFCSVSSPSDPFFTGTRTEQGVLVKVPVAGPLFITLNGRNEPGEHTVTVEDLGPDDHGDRASEATPLTLGVPVDGVLEHPEDKDAFSVELAANEPRQALFPVGMFVLVVGPDAWTRSLNAEGRFTTWSAGRYTLQVGATTPNGLSGRYQLELR